MRILHINCNYMTTALHQTMIEHLDKTGIYSCVFAPVYNAGNAAIKPNDNVIVSECFAKWDRLHFGYKQSKIQTALESSVNVAAFDCIHAYTLFTDGNCAWEMSKKYGIPFVVAVRNTDMNDFLRLKPWLSGRAVKIMEDASAIFFLSPRYMEMMLDKYVPASKRECIRKKCQVIPNGIDDFWHGNLNTEVKAPEQKKVKLVYAGRIDKNKNIPTTQAAMKILREKGYETSLTVVGKVQDEKEFALIKLDPYTQCLPAMPKEKLIDVYRAADIFVMPSFAETFGLVYAEAMSQGLPVLYTKGQGFDGQFPEGSVGYAVDPNSPEDIAQKIMKVLDTHDQLRMQSLRLVPKFNWSAIVKDYVAVYSKK